MADTLVRTPKPRADKETSAGTHLPYARHVDDATIATRDGRLIQVIKLDGFLFETADTDELNYRKAVRETMLRGIANSRFAIYHHVVRREVEPRLEGDYPDAFSRSLHEAWRGRLATRRLYVNDLFLTIVRRPLQGRLGVLDDLLSSMRGAASKQEAEASLARDLSALNGARDSLVSSLSAYGARLLTAYDGPQGVCSEPLEFLSTIYNGELRPVRLPKADLGLYLPYRRISFGADAFELSAAGRAPDELRGDDLGEGLSGPDRARNAGRPPAPARRDGADRELRLRGAAGDARPHEHRAPPHARRRRRGAQPARRPLHRQGRRGRRPRQLRRTPPQRHGARAHPCGAHRSRRRRAGRLHRARRHRRARGREPGARLLGAVSRQLQGHRPPRPDLLLELRRARQPAQLPGGAGGRGALGLGDHAAGDDLRRPLPLQLPPRGPRQLHHHRPLWLGEDGGAWVPASPRRRS